MVTPKRVTLLETVHGSHLYGLARPDSDLDTYRVMANLEEPGSEARRPRSVKTKQTLAGQDDVLVTGLTAFLLKCDEGVPQALEAMFSPVATGLLLPFCKSYYLSTPHFAVTYRRTVMNFARLGVTEERALELLAPTETEELRKKRVKESVRAKKPRRVERHGLLKYRRHSLRLMLNRETGLEQGRFSPRLSDAERAFVVGNAELPDEKFARLVLSFCSSES